MNNLTPCLLQYLERRPDGGNAYKVRFLSSAGLVDTVVQLSTRKLDDSGNDNPIIDSDIQLYVSGP
jgi:hypothetical protein